MLNVPEANPRNRSTNASRWLAIDSGDGLLIGLDMETSG
jgi:hypothetical protein